MCPESRTAPMGVGGGWQAVGMRTVVALARASHLAPTVAVTTFTTALAAAAGGGARAGWVAAAVLAGQLSVGWSNDWLDRHRDRAAGRTDKPLVRGDVGDDTVRNGAALAVVACAALSLPLGWRPAAIHLLAVALAWSYNAGLKSTPVSVVPYMAAFALLPVFVTLALPEPSWPPLWIIAGGGLLGAGAHFANVLPDLETDRRTGVIGLPHRLGAGASVTAATLSLAGAVAVVTAGTWPPGVLTAIALVATVTVVLGVPVSWFTARRDLAFRLAIAAAAGAVLALLANAAQLG